MSNALTNHIISLATSHAERAGQSDYLDRADDVESGQQPANWAWPLDTADEAYINAVGPEQILRDAGLPDDCWDVVVDAWCDAFCRGFRMAHDNLEGE